MTFFHVGDRSTTAFVHVKGILFDETTIDSLSVTVSTQPHSLKDALSNIDGEFAFVYTDSERMVVFRDVFGTRPLYMYKDTSSCIVGFSFQEDYLEIHGKPCLFPKGSYWTSDSPDTVFSVRQHSGVVPVVACTDVLEHVMFLLIRAVEKRVANKKAIVIQTGNMYSEMLSLVYNTIASRCSYSTTETDFVILSTIGARVLFERKEERLCINDERYTSPFVDRELVAFMRKLSFWTDDLTYMLYNRLFMI